MSDQATIFELPYNLFLMQRMEFVVICGDQLAASIMRVVEAEMIKRKEAWQVRVEKAIENKKPLPKEPKTWWVQLSQAQIIARLYMYDSAKLKKPESEDLQSPEWVEYRYKKALSISKGTLRKAIDLLENLGFLLERGKPGDEFGAPIWTLHKENVQKALKALPENPFAIFHALGGGSKFEYGGEVQNLNVPPTNFESGDTQNLNVPGSENECGEVQNLNVNIDSSIDPLEDTEIDNEIEGTDANASTPAHEEDTPYVPDFSAHTPRELIPVVSEEIEHVETMKEQASRIAAQPSDPVQGVGYEKPRVVTSQASSSQPRAKAEPRKPRVRSQGREHTIYFSVEGAAFRAWYEEIFEMQLDETAANARACNALGKLASVTYEHVKLVKREIDLNKWAQANNVAVTPQDLADDKSNIRWEKWLQSAQKRAKQPQRAQPKGDNNLADWVAESEQQQAQISREESARRTEEARRKLAAVQQQIAAQKAAERQQQAVHYLVKGESYA